MPGPIGHQPRTPASSAHAASPPTAPTPGAPPCRRFSVLLGEAPPMAGAPGDATRPAGPLSAGPTTSDASPADAARRFVARVLEDERAIDRGLEQALRGRTFTPEQLLALQTKVYEYSQQLDVASRIIDKLASAVKQTLQTQV